MDRIKAFFMRIGMDPDTPIRHDIALLREIQSRSVCAIAYENLDIVAGNPLDLSEEGLFRKIVTEHRGGAPVHMEENISDERRARLLREIFLLNV